MRFGRVGKHTVYRREQRATIRHVYVIERSTSVERFSNAVEDFGIYVVSTEFLHACREVDIRKRGTISERAFIDIQRGHARRQFGIYEGNLFELSCRAERFFSNRFKRGGEYDFRDLGVLERSRRDVRYAFGYDTSTRFCKGYVNEVHTARQVVVLHEQTVRRPIYGIFVVIFYVVYVDRAKVARLRERVTDYVYVFDRVGKVQYLDIVVPLERVACHFRNARAVIRGGYGYFREERNIGSFLYGIRSVVLLNEGKGLFPTCVHYFIFYGERPIYDAFTEFVRQTGSFRAVRLAEPACKYVLRVFRLGHFDLERSTVFHRCVRYRAFYRFDNTHVEFYVIGLRFPIRKEHGITAEGIRFVVAKRAVAVRTARYVVPTAELVALTRRCGQIKHVATGVELVYHGRTFTRVELHRVRVNLRRYRDIRDTVEVCANVNRIPTRSREFHFRKVVAVFHDASGSLGAVYEYFVFFRADYVRPRNRAFTVSDRVRHRHVAYVEFVAPKGFGRALRFYGEFIIYRFRPIDRAEIKAFRRNRLLNVTDLDFVRRRAFYFRPRKRIIEHANSRRRSKRLLIVFVRSRFTCVIALRLRVYAYGELLRAERFKREARRRAVIIGKRRFAVFHFYDVVGSAVHGRPIQGLRRFVKHELGNFAHRSIVHEFLRYGGRIAFRNRFYREYDTALLHRAVREVEVGRVAVIVSFVIVTLVSAVYRHVVLLRVFHRAEHEQRGFGYREGGYSLQRFILIVSYRFNRVLRLVVGNRGYFHDVVARRRVREVDRFGRTRHVFVDRGKTRRTAHFQLIRRRALHRVPRYGRSVYAYRGRSEFIFRRAHPRSVQSRVFAEYRTVYVRIGKLVRVLVRGNPPTAEGVPVSFGRGYVVNLTADRFHVYRVACAFVVEVIVHGVFRLTRNSLRPTRVDRNVRRNGLRVEVVRRGKRAVRVPTHKHVVFTRRVGGFVHRFTVYDRNGTDRATAGRIKAYGVVRLAKESHFRILVGQGQHTVFEGSNDFVVVLKSESQGFPFQLVVARFVCAFHNEGKLLATIQRDYVFASFRVTIVIHADFRSFLFSASHGGCAKYGYPAR